MSKIIIREQPIVKAGESVKFEMPFTVPNDETYLVHGFGGADINLGDNKSTIFSMLFGKDGANEKREIVDCIVATGNTSHSPKTFSIKGDGEKKLFILVKNYSGFDKQCPFWLEMQKVNISPKKGK